MLVLIFSIAMGLLETIVVVYLRKIFYPAGFKFPLEFIPNDILQVEILRELCTLVMLISIALIAGKNKLQVFSYFLLSFAIWDITYYVGLKIILNWPVSLFTWDILFLIPIPWIGPVVAPVISSLSMIILSISLLLINERFANFKIKLIEWFLLLIGAVLIFISFILDYINILISKNLLTKIFTLNQAELQHITFNYMPSNYNWILFILGLSSVYLSMFLFIKRYFYLTKNY